MAISERMKRMSNVFGITLKSEGFSGELYNCYEEKAEPFEDVTEFFNIVNAFLDALEYPEQKIKYRAFKKTLPELKIIDIDPAKKLFEVEHLLESCKNRAFLILITGRDNATWQGTVYNKAKDRESSFNSEIELLNIINK